MNYKELYEEWLSNPCFDDETKAELRAISDDENEIKERFYQELEFGTAGLRGIIGAGVNRMNVYTVRKATQGLANYILKVGGADKGVAIAYDSRRMSPEFADVAALCLNANGIKAYVFDDSDGTVKEVSVTDLNEGDSLVFTKNNDETRDIVDTILGRLVDEKKLDDDIIVCYHKSKRWKEALREYMIKNSIPARVCF